MEQVTTSHSSGVNPALADAVQAGQQALRDADNFTARQHFRRALELDPDHVLALVGMASAVFPYREKREYLLQAQAQAPNNSEIAETLAYVEARIAAGEVLAPKPRPAQPEVSESAMADAQPEVLTCYIHPDRETGLRCTNCNRPICASCLTRAPVGQLCPECSRMRRPTNYQVSWPVIVGVGALSAFAGLLLSLATFFILDRIPFFAFIVAFLVGPIIANGYTRLLDWMTRAKRGRQLQLAAGIGLGLGFAPLALLILVVAGFQAIFSLLLQLVMAGVIIAGVMRNLR